MDQIQLLLFPVDNPEGMKSRHAIRGHLYYPIGTQAGFFA